MIACDFCGQRQPDGTCRLGLNVPKTMGCREFDPAMERFCSEPKDFAGRAQVVEMAAFFGMKGSELKKVNLMASREERARSQV